MNERAKELVQLVNLVQKNAPQLSLDNAIRLAVAAQQSEIMDDAVIVLGDIADALNDMRPMSPPPKRLH